MIKRLMIRMGVAAAISAFSMSAFGAVVNGVFTINTANIVDLYSATFDGPLNPASNFWGGTTPAGRAIVITPTGTGSGTLDVDYDSITGEILQVNSLEIFLPQMQLTIAGTTVIDVIPGNGAPAANDLAFIRAGNNTGINNTVDVEGPIGSSNAFAATEIGNAAIFRHDDAPNLDAPDFATFNDIVDSCTGGLCSLIGILSLDGVRYEISGGGMIGNNSFTLTTQTGNNSIYQVDFTTVVPVPAAVWLFGSALGLLGWMRRRVA